jgi:hypothetical protein
MNDITTLAELLEFLRGLPADTEVHTFRTENAHYVITVDSKGRAQRIPKKIERVFSFYIKFVLSS